MEDCTGLKREKRNATQCVMFGNLRSPMTFRWFIFACLMLQMIGDAGEGNGMRMLVEGRVVTDEIGGNSSEQAKIVGGDPALPGRYPYMVALTTSLVVIDGSQRGAIQSQIKNQPDPRTPSLRRSPWSLHDDGGLFEMSGEETKASVQLSRTSIAVSCGGVLISERLVLTAAHCEDIVQAFVGCYDSTNVEDEIIDGDCETFNVVERVVHPDYGFATLGSQLIPVNDFMVLVLDGESTKKPVSFMSDESFTPEAAADVESEAGNVELLSGDLFTVLGWGDLSFGGIPSDVLRQVDINYITNEECRDYFTTKSRTTDLINASAVRNLDSSVIEENILCGFTPGRDSCQRDSGGPAIVRCDITEEDILIALVSWGFGCADPRFPGGYSRVSFALPFIQSVISNYSQPALSTTTLAGIERDTFCTVNGTKAPTATPPAPTSPPTIPIEWTCVSISYGSRDGCHCDCGVPDPDCDIEPAQLVLRCNTGEICLEGRCVEPDLDTFSPTIVPTSTSSAPFAFPFGPTDAGTLGLGGLLGVLMVAGLGLLLLLLLIVRVAKQRVKTKQQGQVVSKDRENQHQIDEEVNQERAALVDQDLSTDVTFASS